MLPLQPRQQKIYVTCLVEHNGQVLLLRGSQYTDQASSGSIGYFGLPRFTLSFGASPTEVITKELENQFDQKVIEVTIISVSEQLSNQHTHAVELVYRVEVAAAMPGQPGRYLFASQEELAEYVLPTELERLQAWLDR